MLLSFTITNVKLMEFNHFLQILSTDHLVTLIIAGDGPSTCTLCVTILATTTKKTKRIQLQFFVCPELL